MDKSIKLVLSIVMGVFIGLATIALYEHYTTFKQVQNTTTSMTEELLKASQ